LDFHFPLGEDSMSSLPQESIEERLSQLEKEVASLKDKKAAKKNWLSKLAGTAVDDKDYEEILRLGKEARDAERLEE
jgi:uncharacterized small protein (DUF1192 family)